VTSEIHRTYLEVAVNNPRARGLYHYHLPPELEGKISPGCLVVVPFGPQTHQGVVLRFVHQPQVVETRPVQDLVDSRPVFTPAQMALGEWLAENSLAPLGACLDAMIPPGLSQHADILVSLNRPTFETAGGLAKGYAPLQARILALLERRGDLRGRQLEAGLPQLEWRKAVHSLARAGLVRTLGVLPPPGVRSRFVRTAQLACPPAEIEALATREGQAGLKVTDLGNSRVVGRRLSILRFLAKEPWPVELPWVYAQTGGNIGDLEKLGELGLITLQETESWRDPLADITPVLTEPPRLTTGQAGVLQSVLAGLAASARGETVRPFLLHGVTGSGKTEIYLQAVAEVLRQGKQAIVLVPEIALTPQTIRRFLGRFPGQVGVVHSRLSQGERYDTWRRARNGELPVIVGARSALFAPLPRLALIVVDECHDESYYQDGDPPSYHAASAAVAYARLAGAVCLLGSATPDVTQAYLAEQGAWQLLSLPLRLLAHRQVAEQDLRPTEQEVPGEQQKARRSPWSCRR
jgi:primosomal protein N' (replication factor Y)